jgi:hypothetical protein
MKEKTMKTLNRIFAAALTLALTFPLSIATEPQPAVADLADLLVAPQGVGNALGAVSTDVGILIKYVGSSPAGGVVTVAAATGDITLETGVVGGATADLTTECPVSGALGGVIDVSDAACNTMGEVVDAINSSPNWRAVLVDALRSDASTSTNGILITKAATSASDAEGVALLKDTTEALNTTVALIPFEARNDIRFWLNDGPSGSTVAKSLNENPFNDHLTVFQFTQETFTGTGADNWSLISSKDKLGRCGTAVASTASSIICGASQQNTTLIVRPGGTTGVATTFDYSEGPIYGQRGAILRSRVTAATTYTAAVHSAVGVQGQYKKANP